LSVCRFKIIHTRIPFTNTTRRDTSSPIQARQTIQNLSLTFLPREKTICSNKHNSTQTLELFGKNQIQRNPNQINRINLRERETPIQLSNSKSLSSRRKTTTTKLSQLLETRRHNSCVTYFFGKENLSLFLRLKA